MKTILLVPLRDYYQSRKRIWVKYLIPVVLGLLALAGALIFNIGNEETIRSTFSEFVNVQIIYLVILIGIALIRPIIPLQALKYVAAVCIFAIMHILGVLLESVAQMYLTFWRNR